MEELLYYQIKAELALEAGNVEEATVWAALANSVATALTGRGPGPFRNRTSMTDRQAQKDRVRNGQWPIEPEGSNVQPNRPGPSPAEPAHTPGKARVTRVDERSTTHEPPNVLGPVTDTSA